MARDERAGVRTLGFWVGAGALVAAVSATPSTVDGTTTREAAVTRVIDGDTFAVVGEAYPPDCGPTGRKRYCDTKIRVRNFDTAELRDYDCAEELAQARRARDVAAEILRDARVTLIVEEVDRFGRPVADVLVHRGTERVDFVDAMVARGAGARWRYGEEPQPVWCPTVVAEGPGGRQGDGAVDWREIGGRLAAALGRWFGAF